MNNDATRRIEDFFQAERKFLNKFVDLPKILEMEGWKQIPSRLQGITKFQLKGRIVEVTFHKGADAYQWNDDLKKSGTSLDLLKDDREVDTKKRFMDAITKLREYGKRLVPERSEQFYSQYADVLDILKKGVKKTPAMDPYMKMEKDFLSKEVSIYKVANELGFKPTPETKVGKTYFKKGDAVISLKKSEDNGIYLWYDHTEKKGGTIFDFVAKELNIDKDKATEKLKEFAMNLLPEEKLQEFLIKSYDIKTARHQNSLQGMVEDRLSPGAPVIPIDLDKFKKEINEFEDEYRVNPLFKLWSSREVVEEIIPRHFRIPDLNKAFIKVASETGGEVARELARHALINLAVQKVPGSSLKEAINNEMLSHSAKQILFKVATLKAKSPIEENQQKVSELIGQFNVDSSQRANVHEINQPSSVKGRSI